MQSDVMEMNITQNYQTGEIVREWVVAETITCIAKTIITDTGSNRDSGTEFNKQFKENNKIKINSASKISSRKKVTNIRNADDQVVLFTENKIDDSPTIYDVQSSIPIFDPFGKIVYYETLLYRSDVQVGN
jgi:hypothetical protein